jgi:hypothetical protein
MSFTFQIWPPPIATALAAGRRGSPVNIGRYAPPGQQAHRCP